MKVLPLLWFCSVLMVSYGDGENVTKRDLLDIIGDRIRNKVRQRIQERLENPSAERPLIMEVLHNRVHNFKKNLTNVAKECFKNEHGYKCCSVELLTFLGTALKNHPLLVRLLSRVDMKRIVEKIMELVQLHFKTSFEVVVAPSDFASKSTFRGDLMCKTKTPSGKVVLVYATPIPYSTDLGVSRRLTSSEIKAQNWLEAFSRISQLAMFAGKKH